MIYYIYCIIFSVGLSTLGGHFGIPFWVQFISAIVFGVVCGAVKVSEEKNKE